MLIRIVIIQPRVKEKKRQRAKRLILTSKFLVFFAKI
jgi:hypothetical protein